MRISWCLDTLTGRESAVRRVKPIEVWYGKTEWHPKEQWFLKAMDLEKGEERNFAIRDILRFL
jgi:hypothetical protein